MTAPTRVPLQDLGEQHRPIQSELEEAARRVLSSGRFVLGREVAAFESEVASFCGVPHAVGVSSGTDALLATLMALGVGPGSEVVTTPFTFFATAGVIVRLGARPVFADIEPGTMNIDPAKAAARVGPRTAAVLVVHLFGRLAQTAAIEAACASRDIPMIEDGAQAIGACDEGGAGAGAADAASDEVPRAALAGVAEKRPDLRSARRLGTVGRAAALSFFPAKALGGFGDGGMVLTTDPALADRVRALRVHGAREKHHHALVGGNFRLDELQAALLRVKLARLPAWLDARRRLAHLYREALAETPVILPPADRGGTWSSFVIRVPDRRRDDLARVLAAREIETAVYYPRPLPAQPALADLDLGYRPGDLPEAERAAAEVLALPLYPELREEQLMRVVSEIRRYYGLG